MEDDADAAARMITVNFTWPVAALAEIRRRLVAQGSGRILVISSVAAVRVRRVRLPLRGAKAGLDRLCSGSPSLSRAPASRCRSCGPGVVRTKMTAGQGAALHDGRQRGRRERDARARDGRAW